MNDAIVNATAIVCSTIIIVTFLYLVFRDQ